jgi:hypothetical protein
MWFSLNIHPWYSSIILLRLHTSTCGVYRVVFSRSAWKRKSLILFIRVITQYTYFDSFMLRKHSREIAKIVYTRWENYTFQNFPYSYHKFFPTINARASRCIFYREIKVEKENFWHDIKRACRLTFIWCVNYYYGGKMFQWLIFTNSIKFFELIRELWYNLLKIIKPPQNF